MANSVLSMTEAEQAELLAHPGWQTAQRIVASNGFRRSSMLSGFLLYVCERHILGRDEETTEQQIGVAVFNRSSSYDPGEDNIVRNYARTLRQRLDDYYAVEGAEEPLQIAIPRGGYVPLFFERDALVGERLAAQSEASVQTPATDHNPAGSLELPRAEKASRPFWSVPGVIAASLLLPIVVAGILFRVFYIQSHTSTANRFWSLFFDKDRDTFLVAADSGLAMLVNLSKQPVTLQQYLQDGYVSSLKNSSEPITALIQDFGRRRYTSVVDLGIASSISQLPQAVPQRLKVRYAREVGTDDLRQSNVILSGALSSNPWVELFQRGMDIQFAYDDKNQVVIRNLHPQSGEAALYATDEDSPDKTTYGIVAVVPGIGRVGRALIIGGLNMAGTQAAADFVFTEVGKDFMESVLHVDPHRPCEILIETSNIAASSSHPRQIAKRCE